MHSNQRKRLVTISTWASVLVASTLILIKLYAWFVTGSISLLASLLDSVMDLLASGISFFAVRLALQPPDDNHRFGHGKAEPLAALAQAAFVAGSAMMLALQSADRIIGSKHTLSEPLIGIGVTLFSIVLTFGLVAYQQYVIRRVHSEAIQADALHYTGDLALNGAVLLALILANFGLLWVDPLVGLGIAAFLAYGVFKIARQALASLMDEEVGPEIELAIRKAVATIPDCKGVHDIRTRRAGPQLFAQIHLEFDGHLSLKSAHDTGERLVARLQQEFPNLQITIHHDPL